MQIYTNVVIDIETNEVLEEESFEYNGPLAQCISVGGGEERSEQRLKKVPVWNEGQEKTFDLLYKAINQGFNRGTPKYPGQMYVPQTDLESKYLQGNNMGLADNIARTRTLGEASWKRAGDAAYELNPEVSAEYFNSTIRDPMMHEFRDTHEPLIREMFGDSNYYSSARTNAQTELASNLARDLAGKRADIMYQDEIARRGALESAAEREATIAPQMAGILNQSDLMGAQFAEQMAADRAGYSRTIENEKMLGELQQWMMEQDSNNPYTQMMFQILGLQPNVVGTEGESEGSNVSMGILSG